MHSPYKEHWRKHILSTSFYVSLVTDCTSGLLFCPESDILESGTVPMPLWRLLVDLFR